VGMGAAAQHGSCGRAGVTPSISPTCSGAAMELSSVRSHAAGVVDCHPRLHVVLVGVGRWPWLAVKGGGVGVGEN
jgi:predicted TIM-barrel fold metal-dependent hydrolase